MAPKAAAPTAKVLQALLTRIGSASSGTKGVLLSRLSRELQKPRISNFTVSDRHVRILSIDMGIKNLAFCAADIRPPSNDDLGSEMFITAWQRLHVYEEMAKSTLAEEKEEGSSAGENQDEEDLYTPSAMSNTAYSLLTRTLLQCDPDIILIERQRWRSSSSSAIQQWTVRVNMLESMLWAVLTTLRKVRGPLEGDDIGRMEVFGVDPKRVGSFWIGQYAQNLVDGARAKGRVVGDESKLDLKDGTEQAAHSAAGGSIPKKTTRTKAEKKAKIQVLRSWLDSGDALPSTLPASANHPNCVPKITFRFSEEADATRRAFCTVTGKGTKGYGDGGVLKKFDDITDCLLQAAAWVAWEANRLQINQSPDHEEERDRTSTPREAKRPKKKMSKKARGAKCTVARDDAIIDGI